jgi:hypothetical protein
MMSHGQLWIDKMSNIFYMAELHFIYRFILFILGKQKINNKNIEPANVIGAWWEGRTVLTERQEVFIFLYK